MGQAKQSVENFAAKVAWYDPVEQDIQFARALAPWLGPYLPVGQLVALLAELAPALAK